MSPRRAALTAPRALLALLMALALALLPGMASGAAPGDAGGDVYRVGAARKDVTGPVAHINMMGYADIMQRASGLLNRLYARAYVVERDGEAVAIVHCDLHSIPIELHEVVAERVAAATDGKINANNILLHGQHTHSGPGGLHTYFLYALAVLGFSQRHFDLVADQLVAAILEAAADLQPRRLYITHATLKDCSVNRSPEAYDHNPAAERAKYPSNKNTEMTIIKLTDAHNPADLHGLWTFFPVHTTSLQGTGSMIGSDNKGYAQWQLEERFAKANPDFLAAFFQSEAGDISPNTVDKKDGTFTGVHGDDWVRNAEFVGHCQADAAFAALDGPDSAWEPVSGPVLSRKASVDFSHYEISPGKSTCPAVSGVNMVAGTEDYRGLFFVHEGRLRTERNALVEFIGKWILVPAHVPEEVEQCHSPKVPLFATGLSDPPATPQVLPIQAIGVGQLAIAAVPFEVTTMAGRRITDTLRQALPGARHSVLAAVSNAYAGYLATAEEYQAQHYEGACTHFGPNQLAAVQDSLARVAAGRPLPAARKERKSDPAFHVVNAVGTQLLDHARSPPWVSLGDKIAQSTPTLSAGFTRGEVAEATFWCGRPMNSQVIVESFCDLEQQAADGTWRTVLRDHDWNVRFLYRPRWLFFGQCTCQYAVPLSDRQAAIPAGSPTFRLRFRGAVAANAAEPEVPRIYEGLSSPFNVSDAVHAAPVNTATSYNYGLPEELVLAALTVLVAYLLVRFLRRLRAPGPPPKAKQG